MFPTVRGEGAPTMESATLAIGAIRLIVSDFRRWPRQHALDTGTGETHDANGSALEDP